eukprot:6173533-Pleurochrysis_carterae.AAC.3
MSPIVAAALNCSPSRPAFHASHDDLVCVSMAAEHAHIFGDGETAAHLVQSIIRRCCTASRDSESVE